MNVGAMVLKSMIVVLGWLQISAPSSLWAVILSKTEDAEPKSVSETMMTIGGFVSGPGLDIILGVVAARYRWRESLNAASPEEFRLKTVGNSSMSIIRRWEGEASRPSLPPGVSSAPSNSSPPNFSPRPRNSSNWELMDV